MKKQFMKKKSIRTFGILLGVLVLLLTICTGCGEKKDDTVIRVGGLKGPTTMGILFMQEKGDGFSDNQYDISMVTAADELSASVVRGDVDIALVPANVASVLYAKTEGQIKVIDVNTLGVLYMLSGDSSLEGEVSLPDLKGRTIYLTGMGTTPDYTLRALLQEYELTEEISLEYKSEPAEVAALLAEDTNAIGLLPQPFVTSAMMQNNSLHILLDIDAEFKTVFGNNIVTGVTIVRTEFLDQHKELVDRFLQDHDKSIQMINENVEKGAELVVNAGILPKAPVAQKAIPGCHLFFLQGNEMKEQLGGYLSALSKMDLKAVGGSLPAEDFYYVK